MSTDEKIIELQQLLVGAEGYMPDDAAEIARDGFTRKPEEAEKMLVDLRERAERLNRPRWVKPADGAIDFIVEQNRRDRAAFEAECDADEAHGDRVCEQLSAVMKSSELHSMYLISTTVRALLDMLELHDMTCAEACGDIVKVLKAMNALNGWNNETLKFKREVTK